MTFQKTELLYENPLSRAEDIKDFRLEGDANISFPQGRMFLKNAYKRDMANGRHANFILWCEREFPDHISVSWDFRPMTDEGLAMFWISARGRKGEDLFDASLAPRNGDYAQYFDGDIDALHVSYFRRNPSEIIFRTCNLRKSHGFHMMSQSADPLPDARNAKDPYRMEVVKSGSAFLFSINDFPLINWIDDGLAFGPVLSGGKIGFRQMAGLVAEYADLQVHAVELGREG